MSESNPPRAPPVPTAHDVMQQVESLQIEPCPRPTTADGDVRRQPRRSREPHPPICGCDNQVTPSKDHPTEETGQDGPSLRHGNPFAKLQEPVDSIAGTTGTDAQRMDCLGECLKAVVGALSDSLLRRGASGEWVRNLVLAFGNPRPRRGRSLSFALSWADCEDADQERKGGPVQHAGRNQGGWCHLRQTCPPFLTKPSEASRI